MTKKNLKFICIITLIVWFTAIIDLSFWFTHWFSWYELLLETIKILFMFGGLIGLLIIRDAAAKMLKESDKNEKRKDN